MATNRKIFGVLILVLLSASIYIMLPEKVKLHVDNDKTSIYVWENSSWKLGGVEKNYLYNGTRMVTRVSNSILVNQISSGNLVNITRYAKYRNGAEVLDTYTFDGSLNDVEQVPINHNIVIKNGKGLNYRYVASSLTGYPGKLKLNTTEYNFARNIKIIWQEGYTWAWLDYPSKGLNVQYKINSNLETFQIRMFDPIPLVGYCYQETANVSTVCGGLSTGSYSSSFTEFTNVNNLIDGDWETYVTGNVGEKSRENIYYKIPQAALNTSLWQIRWNDTTEYVNLSIAKCIDNPATAGEILLEVSWNSSVGSTAFGCWYDSGGGTTKELLLSKTGIYKIYEESMWWNINLPMLLNLTSPANSSTVGAGNISFNYIVNSTNEIDNCSLYINGSLTELCYQESANATSSCGGLATGSYFVSTAETNPTYFYINYTKPTGYNITNSKWQLKYGTIAIQNATLPNDCWNAYSDKIVLSITSGLTGAAYGTNASCYNGTNWKNVSVGDYAGGCTFVGAAGDQKYLTDGSWTTSAGYGGSIIGWRTYSTGDDCQIYEEAMWWNISSSGFKLNQTTEDASNFSVILDKGDYLWNVECYDVYGNNSWGVNNHTLYVLGNIFNCALNPITTTAIDLSSQEIQAIGTGTWTIEAVVKGKNLSKDNNCNISIENGAGNLTLG